MQTLPTAARDVLDFWIGALDDSGLAAPQRAQQWWAKDPALDEAIRARFGGLHRELSKGLPADWAPHARAKLAAVIVLDQFSRNMYRDTSGMFESDARALGFARELVDSGGEAALAAHERMFVYMPFMHSEQLDDQRRCLAFFERLRDGFTGPTRDAIAHNVGFARRHLEIVERFGRFPHRNAVLGRASTPEEAAFLQQPGSSF